MNAWASRLYSTYFAYTQNARQVTLNFILFDIKLQRHLTLLFAIVLERACMRTDVTAGVYMCICWYLWCMCAYGCAYVCVCAYASICMHVCACELLFRLSASVHVRACAYIHACMYVCAHVVFMCYFVCVCVYTHTHTHPVNAL